jgi:hypothetical protein
LIRFIGEDAAPFIKNYIIPIKDLSRNMRHGSKAGSKERVIQKNSSKELRIDILY